VIHRLQRRRHFNAVRAVRVCARMRCGSLCAFAQVRSGAIDVVVVDSVAALVPRQEIDGEMGDAHIALQARMMSSGLRKLLSSLHVSRSCMIIFLNQVGVAVRPCGVSRAVA
jgi:RecA/RadA recombinase